MDATPTDDLHARLARRFGEAPRPPPDLPGRGVLEGMADHRSCRAFRPDPVAAALVETVVAAAFCAPSKSDLQQRDLVWVEDVAQRRRLEALVPSVDWLPRAPVLLMVLGNNRRQRRLHEMRGHPFANDQLDAFFNAATDAAVLLGWLVVAAEASGLGTCPISQFRNDAEAVSEALGLPAHVFPYAGLAMGWPERVAPINPRLPLAATLHRDRFDDSALPEHVADADARRIAGKPFPSQRNVAAFGTAEPYGWSEDVTRQYARPERAGFGAYVRRRGFCLD
ncbi:nitroreductase family protein [Roseomonas sp. CCTCC AB2023176]|uniref:nitroreductase family protein n=1 Tax=Roseomonas sp. CCTCC AB2023176 TaxID=3342640 RepID=UPI0035DFEDD1